MPAEPPPILSLLPSWDTIQSHLPHTTPIAALITIALFSLYLLYHILRITFRRSPHAHPSPHYTGDLSATGQRHGQGRLRLLNGNVYVGGFVEGLFEGQGVYQFKATGTTYEGGFVRGKPEGRGRETYGEGSRYEGEFRGGEREGEGRMEYGNGGAYEGGWRAGKKHGRGRVRETKEGPWREGVWVEGKLQRGGEGKSGMRRGVGGEEDANEGKFVLDDELPQEVQVRERKRKEEAKAKQSKAS